MTPGGLVGRQVTRDFHITDEVVARYADLVNDHNPIHIDPVAAAVSRFGGPIAHGMLVGSLFSGLIASELPGPGSVYLTQSLRFRRPTPVGAKVVVTVTCTADDGSRATLETTVADVNGEILVQGEATVLTPPREHDAA